MFHVKHYILKILKKRMKTKDLTILGYDNKIEKLEKNKKNVKSLAGLCLFISILTIIVKESGKYDIFNIVLWIVSTLLVFVLFYMDTRYSIGINELKKKIYELELEDLYRKKKIAEIRKEILSDTILNKIIIAPEEKVYYPLTYYAIILFLECIIGIIHIFV